MFIFRRFFHPTFYFETPEAGGGGTTAPAAPAVQPTGQGELAQQGSDFWSMFPDVPEEHRPVIEPHLRNTQAEITRLQQQQAALRPVLDAGYQPQQLQGLVAFDQRFQQQPLEVFMDMAAMLQQNGTIHDDLDLDGLRAIAMGQDVQDDQPSVDQGEIPPAVQAYIQRLEQEVNEIKGGIQQQQTRQQEAVQDNLLRNQHNRMRTELQKVGYSAEYLTPDRLNSFILTHKGQVNAAIEDLKNMRMETLKDFKPNPQPDPLETRNGGPQAPKSDVSFRDRNDPWAKARVGAHNRLTRANRDAAQG
jgi:hypothetical protein